MLELRQVITRLACHASSCVLDCDRRSVALPTQQMVGQQYYKSTETKALEFWILHLLDWQCTALVAFRSPESPMVEPREPEGVPMRTAEMFLLSALRTVAHGYVESDCS